MLPQRLRELRTQQKFTQEYVSDKLGITRPAYTAYESGKRQPDYATLEKLATLYGVTTDYLLGRNGTPKWATEKDVIDLQDVLDGKSGASFNFGGETLTDDQNEKFKLAITQAFWDVLKKDKKRGDGDGR